MDDRAEGYRDDAASLREKIARLEERVRERGLPLPGGPRTEQRVSPRRVLTLLALVLAAALAGVVPAALFVETFREGPVYETVTAPSRTEPSPPAKKLTWYEPSTTWTARLGPWPVDVDGTTLLVGLLWRQGERGRGLHAAAFDRKTLKPRWVAGPFPSAWSTSASDRHTFVVSGQSLVLSDAAGTVRVLDVLTGKETGTGPLRRGVTGACIAEDGSQAVMLGFGAYADPVNVPVSFPWELDAARAFFLDPKSRHVSPAPIPPRPYCTPAPYCSPERRDGCQRLVAQPRLPAPLRSGAEWTPGPVLAYGDRTIAVSGLLTPLLVGWRGDDAGSQWERELPHPDFEARRTTHARTHSAMSKESFYHLYPTTRGPWRLAAVDVSTGSVQVDRDLAGSRMASTLLFVTEHAGDLFVRMDDELLVLEARTGRVRGRLEAP